MYLSILLVICVLYAAFLLVDGNYNLTLDYYFLCFMISVQILINLLKTVLSSL